MKVKIRAFGISPSFFMAFFCLTLTITRRIFPLSQAGVHVFFFPDGTRKSFETLLSENLRSNVSLAAARPP